MSHDRAALNSGNTVFSGGNTVLPSAASSSSNTVSASGNTVLGMVEASATRFWFRR
jgi:hypothetical protein